MLSLMRLAAVGLAIAQLGTCVLLRGDGRSRDLRGERSRNTVRGSSDPLVKPHIVFVLADDLGYNGIGYNNAEIKTPTLDQLANEGVKLRSYYAAPVCGPSRFSLLTGRLPWKSEAWMSNQFDGGIPSGTSLSYTMLPAALKAAGYKTHMVGKWHQGYYLQDFQPHNRGFDTFYGSLQGCVYHQSQELCEAHCDNGGRVLDLTDSTRQITADDIDTSLTADDRYRLRAVELIRNHSSALPMFLFVSFHHPHTPLDAPVGYSSRFNFDETDKNSYYGMIANLDDNVEEIRKALVEVGMWQDTLFIFSSDNGGSRKDIESHSFRKELNYPLKGFKGHVDEGGIKVPAFVSGGFLPGRAKGSQRDDLTSITDWYGTLTNLVGAQVDNQGIFNSDSISNWKYIIGERKSSARTGLLQFATSGHAYIEGKWKLRVQSDGRWPRLFNLEDDPSEEHDVSAGNWEIVSRLGSNFEDESFKSFLGNATQLPTCEHAGYSNEAFSEKVCPTDSDVFLKELVVIQHSFIGCW